MGKTLDSLADEELALLALTHGSEAVIITHLDGRILYANGPTARLLGYAIAELKGRQIGELHACTQSDSWAACMAKLDRRRILVERITLRARGGREVPIQFALVRTEVAGEVCVIGYGRGFRADPGVIRLDPALPEARDGALAGAVPGAAVLDCDGRIVSTNAQWLQVPFCSTDSNAAALAGQGNLLAAYERLADLGSEVHKQKVAGVRAILDGGQTAIALEYCAADTGDLIRVTMSPCLEPGNAAVITREDVTPCRAATAITEDKLRELQRLALVAERTSSSVILLDAQGRVTWANSAFAKVSGLDPSYLIGRELNEVLVSDRTDPETVANIQTSTRSGYPLRCEVSTSRSDGSEYWMDLEIQPLVADDGLLSGFIVLHTDITRHVKLRESLLVSEERLRVTIENASLGVYELNLAEGTVQHDASWCRLLGYHKNELSGAIGEWQQLVHPEDWPQVSRKFTEDRGHKRRVSTTEVRVRHRDGHWLWVQDTSTVVEIAMDGTARRMVGVIMDITARKEAELSARRQANRLSVAAEAANLGVWDYDLVANAYEWNDRMREIHGVDCRTTEEIEKAFRFIHPDDQARTHAAIKASYKTGRYRGRYRILRPDGAIRLLEAWAVIEVSKDSRPLRSVGVVADVTERAQQDFDRQRVERLQSIGQLAAGIAHEINTPTQYIGDNIRFLKDAFGELAGVLRAPSGDPAAKSGPARDSKVDADLDYLLGEIPQAIEQSLEGVTRVTSIVRAMKDFTHPSTDKTPVDVNRAIASTLVVATNEWKYVADVTTDFCSDLPLIPLMPGEFNQVILNLVVNAAHAIAEKLGDNSRERGAITVATRLKDRWIEIVVADTGCGISPAVRNRLFEPFFTTKPVGKGTGQGLSIAHQVVTHHGGTISVDSQVGQGSAFTLRFPLDDPDAGQADAASAA